MDASSFIPFMLHANFQICQLYATGAMFPSQRWLLHPRSVVEATSSAASVLSKTSCVSSHVQKLKRDSLIAYFYSRSKSSFAFSEWCCSIDSRYLCWQMHRLPIATAPQKKKQTKLNLGLTPPFTLWCSWRTAVRYTKARRVGCGCSIFVCHHSWFCRLKVRKMCDTS